MTEAQSDMDFDEDFFSPEELAMMNGSDGETENLFVSPTVQELQAQLQQMAQLVDEGCEREPSGFSPGGKPLRSPTDAPGPHT
ncbi:MAG: hypothetical protein AAGF15_04165, partial [Pseudomonadota bacterium]